LINRLVNCLDASIPRKDALPSVPCRTRSNDGNVFVFIDVDIDRYNE
jgi:hypothetical protein